jgi:nicotinate-nucleotide pyrophosphorylase (carboxylating)
MSTTGHAATFPLDALATDVAQRALAEDLAYGPDATTEATVPSDLVGTGALVSRDDGVVAGLPVAARVFSEVDKELRCKTLVQDGARVRRGQVLMEVHGPVRSLLTAERTALNLLTQLSGVATLTRKVVDAVAGTGVQVRDSRKTVPGLRLLQKYAVRCGGGVNHRMALGDAVLIKDNHIAAAGGVSAALAAVRAAVPRLPVQVECDTLTQVAEAIEAGARLVLLDNMSVEQLREAVRLARPADVRLEASGGLDLATARAVADTGVDYLAVGALTHSAPALDVGLDLRHPDGKLRSDSKGTRSRT